MLAESMRVYNFNNKEDFTNLYGEEPLSHSGWTNSNATVCVYVLPETPC